MSILCPGEAIVHLVCERELDSPADADRFMPHPGDALANVAVAAARAGAASAPAAGVGAGDAFMGALAAELSRVRFEAARAGEALPGALVAGAAACSGWGAQG